MIDKQACRVDTLGKTTQLPRPDPRSIFLISFSGSDFITPPDSGIREFRAGHPDQFDQTPDVQAVILNHIPSGLTGDICPEGTSLSDT
jgi:hypothetical protein